jgi:hypothetical protein
LRLLHVLCNFLYCLVLVRCITCPLIQRFPILYTLVHVIPTSIRPVKNNTLSLILNCPSKSSLLSQNILDFPHFDVAQLPLPPGPILPFSLLHHHSLFSLFSINHYSKPLKFSHFINKSQIPSRRTSSTHLLKTYSASDHATPLSTATLDLYKEKFKPGGRYSPRFSPRFAPNNSSSSIRMAPMRHLRYVIVAAVVRPTG